ncbi:High mobility group protein D [Operophtera brumata]|uniref:High mobility group protein D n=1 Tax=Operophtera brumata TaxID=104452 RepID=A0A0L7KV35_OPEBR|nr:High mobility group protein D [Operophtera brumata]
MWLNAERSNIKAQYSGLKITEIARKGGDLWRSLDKTPWEQKAKAAMEIYNRQMEVYDANNKPESEHGEETSSDGTID